MLHLDKINQIKEEEELVREIDEKVSQTDSDDDIIEESEKAASEKNDIIKTIKNLLRKKEKGINTPVKEKKPFKFNVQKFMSSRAALVTGCLALIAVASYLNIRFSDDDMQTPAGDSILGSSSYVASNPVDDTDVAAQEDDYFAIAVINRQRVRDEAYEILETVATDNSADVEAKQSALLQMTQMAEEINSEANIESLVRAKGFEECVAVISGENANIIVECDTLGLNEVAQIKEIVYLESGVHPDNIKIIEKE